MDDDGRGAVARCAPCLPAAAAAAAAATANRSSRGGSGGAKGEGRRDGQHAARGLRCGLGGRARARETNSAKLLVEEDSWEWC